MMIDAIEEKIEGAVERAFSKFAKATPWFDPEQAAAYLGCTAGTLKTWRCRGQGPNYNLIQDRLVRYHVDDLDAFVRGEVAR